jgi:hypothetical protein
VVFIVNLAGGAMLLVGLGQLLLSVIDDLGNHSSSP